jgi:hypothetical protein
LPFKFSIHSMLCKQVENKIISISTTLMSKYSSKKQYMVPTNP